MKRLATALMVAGAALLAGNSIADAYHPEPIDIRLSNATPSPGEPFVAEIDGCVVGTEAAFGFQGQTATDTCDTLGEAAARFTAPTQPGTYSGTVALVAADGPTVVSFAITVVGAAATTTVAPIGDLPATGGGSSSSATMSIAAVLLLAGAGMFAVAHMRRRQVLMS